MEMCDSFGGRHMTHILTVVNPFCVSGDRIWLTGFKLLRIVNLHRLLQGHLLSVIIDKSHNGWISRHVPV